MGIGSNVAGGFEAGEKLMRMARAVVGALELAFREYVRDQGWDEDVYVSVRVRHDTKRVLV